MVRWTQAQYDAFLARRMSPGRISMLGAATGIGPPKPKRVRVPRGLNSLERDYFERLNLQVAAGEIGAVLRHESISFELGRGAWFTPDFPVIAMDGKLELHEVKGFFREAARVRIKVAARLFLHFRFVVALRVDGSWRFEWIQP